MVTHPWLHVEEEFGPPPPGTSSDVFKIGLFAKQRQDGACKKKKKKKGNNATDSQLALYNI